MFKKRKVVMLPTNERSQIWMGTPALGLRHDHPGSAPFIKYFHLYFLSDELPQKNDKILCDERNHIKENSKYVIRTCKSIVNDWIMTFEIDGQGENPTWTKKIIATTDTSLTEKIEMLGTGSTYIFNLPQPSQSFIEKFVEEYNKGNVITEVMVEYNESITEIPRPYKSYSEIEHLDGTLKINPKDNTITIRKKKDSLNREEVIKLINKISEEVDFESATQETINEWIEENL